MLPPRTILMVFALCMLGIGTFGEEYFAQGSAIVEEEVAHVEVGQERMRLKVIRFSNGLEGRHIPNGSLTILADQRIIKVCELPIPYTKGLGIQIDSESVCQTIHPDSLSSSMVIWVVRPDHSTHAELSTKFTAGELLSYE